MSITAPYNFVPLNEEVFFPDWAEQVSHDIPFSDGESGEIDITIEAKSPVFVRDSQDEETFCNYKGQYYIPGSSVKGMVRNVLEILSFSRMSFIDDKTYAVRDLRNRDLYMSQMKPQNIFCGWLKKVGNDYKVENCGMPGRIRHEEIDEIFEVEFAKKFKAHFNNGGEFKNKPQFKTAKYKYELLKEENLEQTFDYHKKDKLREVYKKGTQKKGTIVFTGQASARKDKGKFDAKIYEFIFFDTHEELPLDKKVFENFKFAYFDGRKTEPKESHDWAFWKDKLQNGEKIPIFFQKKDKKIVHIGLSYLYKLPYHYGVKDGLYESHFDDKPDLAETIFGFVNNNESLKGRVQFSHCKAVTNKLSALKPRTEVLGTPRASYYPNYVYQNGRIYTTYMDKGFIIAGRKRYPIHKNGPNEKNVSIDRKSKIGTTFAPLPSGTVFKGKLRYHNLKKEELGALLSALTFHNTSNTFHNIGMANALGYGKVSISVQGKDIDEYLNSFEQLMKKSISNWIDSKEITELLTMSAEQQNRGTSLLKYMDLPEFSRAKNGNEFLKRYTQLDNVKSVKLRSVCKTENTPERVSKTKMRKLVRQVWKNELQLFFHPNQIEEFLQQKYVTTPPVDAKRYEKLRGDGTFESIMRALGEFFKGGLSSKETQKLYKTINNFYTNVQ